MRFAKGHGTGNDFVILPDLDARLDLTPALVRRLCDRRTGIGGDGVLRVAPGAAGGWFMDYRNADGSIAEMCGNGVRVFAEYLRSRGLASGSELVLQTRAGLRPVWREPDGRYSVDMGPATVTGKGSAVVGGRTISGLAVDVGNPHLACVVSDPAASFDLRAAPEVDAAEFPEGVNVEVIAVTGDRSIELRVYERGSGETQSCGTGAVAAAVAAATVLGETVLGASAAGDLAGEWTVRVPGGVLAVTPSATASILCGPAVIVAEGEIDPGWLAACSELLAGTS